MIELTRGNILEADAEALVNTVNCVGIMGKGIALQFKSAFPDNYKAYETACRHDELKPGRMFVFETGGLYPKYVINFPTKRDWRAKSRIEDIESGLKALIHEVKARNIKSIAVPPLGCGSGGLQWAKVSPLIMAAFESLPEVRVLLYPPLGTPIAEAMPVRTDRPEMTRPRALLLRLMERYAIPGYQITLLEIQKMAFFLQIAGEKLKLRFERNKYGPYAESLHFMLQRLEGHYIRGYGDRTKQAAIRLLPFAGEPVETFLKGDQEASERLNRVIQLIEGFETPYGMELLATVYWVIQENHSRNLSKEAIIEEVQRWSPRKSNLFTPNHILKALNRLEQQGWVNSSLQPVSS
jgi:O-acetyl-ADP-ribose deacetylase (regulator of RNase III)